MAVKGEKQQAVSQAHQLLLDLLCASAELHVVLMSQKASTKERNIGPFISVLSRIRQK